jgi:hypothetical protein
MKNLRKLGAAPVLTCVLALSAFAGETHAPPCASTDPGEIHAPPCVGQPTPGDMETPTGVSTAPGDMPLASSETSFSEITANVLLNFLPLF